MSLEIKKLLRIDGDVLGYYKKHLELINPFLPVPLTGKEMEVLGGFMSMSGDVAEVDRFGTSSRKVLMKDLGISNGGMGNYLKSLREKGFIKKGEDGVEYIPKVIFPGDKEQVYMFKLVNNKEG